jgi:hypothetical protein
MPIVTCARTAASEFSTLLLRLCLCAAAASVAGCSASGDDGQPVDAGVAAAEAGDAPADRPGDAYVAFDGPAVADSTSSDDGLPSSDGPSSGEAADGCTTDGGLPSELRCTGLYGDWATRTIASDVEYYDPGYKLWSDGAVKRRWIRLPPQTQIDTTDMEDWQFPVGTKIWKESASEVRLRATAA